MSKYTLDNDSYIYDPDRGTVDYQTAKRDVINRYNQEVERLTLHLADDLEYLAHEEAMDPSEAQDA